MMVKPIARAAIWKEATGSIRIKKIGQSKLAKCKLFSDYKKVGW